MWMYRTAKYVYRRFLYFLSILLPFIKSAGDWRLGPAARMVVRLVLLLIIVAVLCVLNRFVAYAWAGPSFLQNYFLPLTFLLVMGLIWAGWWIWVLLRAEPEPSHFPAIDDAWDAAVRTLGHAGIRLGDLPLFLVLGRPQGAEEHLFAAAQLSLAVKQTPPDPLAPLHVYASRDAIYVTCAGASLLGKHAANIALEGIEEYGAAGGDGDGENPDLGTTIRPGGREKEVIKKLAQLVGRTMSVAERRATRRKLNLPLPELRKSQAEMSQLSAGLAHLSRLILRDRQPECPINGVMLLVPVGATDTEQDAQQTAEIGARDLATVRRVMQIQCPVVALVCDMEAVPGFRDFIARVSTTERQARLGQRFPLASPDLVDEALEKQIDQSIHFLCNSYLRDWVYRLFRMDTEDSMDSVTSNTGIFLFLDEMRTRKKNLSRILVQGLAKDAPVPLLYMGCYLAGTGSDAKTEQAFVAGVFNRLEKNQSFVAWTDQALAKDRTCHTRANLGYAVLALVGVGAVAVVSYFFLHKSPPA